MDAWVNNIKIFNLPDSEGNIFILISVTGTHKISLKRIHFAFINLDISLKMFREKYNIKYDPFTKSKINKTNVFILTL